MTKLRLTKKRRLSLYQLARLKIEESMPTDAIDEAYTAAAEAVRSAVLARFPAEDMIVLQKYNYAKKERGVRLRLVFDLETKMQRENFVVFEFRAGDYVLLHQRYQTLIINEPETTRIANYFHALEKRENEIEERFQAYRALIDNAKSYEDVLAVWGEAEELRSQFWITTPVAMITPDVVAQIQTDVEARKKAV
mgnify:CR=1 FL=1